MQHHKGGSCYPAVDIADKSRLFHILVCSAFWGIRKQGQVCHHLDGNKFNNRPSNLIWLSREDHPKFDQMVRAGCILTHEQADTLILRDLSRHAEV
jgi:hypothetical protein